MDVPEKFAGPEFEGGIGPVRRPERDAPSLNLGAPTASAGGIYGSHGCLDPGKLRNRLAELTNYYNTARSSVVREHRPPVRSEDRDEVETLKLMQVEAKGCVGGLVKDFPRQAA